MATSDTPLWYLIATGQEVEPVKEVIEPWDMSGGESFKPEKKTIQYLSWVTCRECSRGERKRYNIFVDGKPSFVYDYHCDKLERRITPWFSCHMSVVHHE